ncbi:MAG: peptidylprolyl isomerase [Alteromonadaceae bacterium]|uniref:Periplasmic chaperone PpiD n=1 Tax=Paraglaciecola chathamensis TaxID=368405 RepID=A0ABS0W979_9ALTE|nr:MULTISPECIES: SurA N-terminal domain-containing protein [Paraglaciecola]MBJ2135332.1 SurA N-terminal domain-containing protein [Paraglaciecola chathamensis]MBN28077.1 peptidylprolyl isomerase [Alteromonadaceae bacterium]|tara:strand:+ start:9820 stop:11703 length:1884 start_codon:yes stop_codon:yes gene_type:complete
MLERIREGTQGTWAMAILGLVILSFVFAGVGSYINSSADTAAAKVNDDTISQADLERAYQNERGRMESQYGEAFAALTADSAYLQQFRQGVLDRLIGDKLIEQAAVDLGLRVSDAQIKQAIVAMPEFQFDGKFDNERYSAVLRQAGFQPNEFRDYMRVDMTRRQLSNALLGSEFTLLEETTQAYKLQQQTRDARYLTVPADMFKGDVTVSQSDVENYYQANITQFDTQQQVSLAYVELSVDDLLAGIEVSEDEAEQYYEQNIQDFRTQEERRASHILIEFGDDQQKAEQQAEDILAKINNGEDFAELAETFSSDTFSAENGGDLDWFSMGMMDPAFEDAAFALQNVGDVSDVVESEFGFHIIKLTDVKPEETSPFADVKEDVIAKLKAERAEEEFYAKQLRMAEVAFETPDTLDEVAAIAEVDVKTTVMFSQDSAPQAVNYPNVVSQAFSDELINDQVNSDVIELEDNHVMFIRVADYEAQRTKSLDEVSVEINDILLAEQAQQAAKEWAETVLSDIQSQQNVSDKLQTKGIEWQEQNAVTRNASQVSPAVVTALFKLTDGEESNGQVVELFNGDVALVQLLEVNEGADLPSSDAAALQNRLTTMRAQFTYSEFINALREQADVEIY